MQATDYGSRDAFITTQTYSVVRKLDGISPDRFAAYWRDVHGPLCARLPGLGFYVQHHFDRTNRAHLWPAHKDIKRIDLDFDGAVEIGFDSEDNAARFSSASPVLFDDEVNLFGWDAAYSLPNGSRTLLDEDPDPSPNGPDRLHRIHLYLNGRRGDGFSEGVDDFAKSLGRSGPVIKLRVHKPETFDNDHPLPPSPVPHEVREDMLRIAVLEVGFATALSARQFFGSREFLRISQVQPDYVKGMGACLVSHVYTFVRNGCITLAGLRGSSTAELITRMGAENHARKEVTSLFVSGGASIENPSIVSMA